jgi:hypothetical protein
MRVGYVVATRSHMLVCSPTRRSTPCPPLSGRRCGYPGGAAALRLAMLELVAWRCGYPILPVHLQTVLSQQEAAPESNKRSFPADYPGSANTGHSG